MIAAVWGDDSNRMIDLFADSDLDSNDNPKKWPGNSDKRSYFIKNGVILPVESIDSREAVGCGDMDIILGYEEMFRREKKNLREFLDNPPQIPGLEFRSVEYQEPVKY